MAGMKQLRLFRVGRVRTKPTPPRKQAAPLPSTPTAFQAFLARFLFDAGLDPYETTSDRRRRLARWRRLHRQELLETLEELFNNSDPRRPPSGAPTRPGARDPFPPAKKPRTRRDRDREEAELRLELSAEMDRRRLEVQQRWSERKEAKANCYRPEKLTYSPVGYEWIGGGCGGGGEGGE